MQGRDGERTAAHSSADKLTVDLGVRQLIIRLLYAAYMESPDIIREAFAVAAHCIVMLLLAWMTVPAQPDLVGWQKIRPGAEHWFGLISSAVFVGLIAFYGSFVESHRSDAESQMPYLWILAGLSASAFLFFVWYIRKIAKANICWRGTTIHYAGPQEFLPIKHELSDVIEMKRSLAGWETIRFKNGAVLKIDPHSSGYRELRNAIEAALQGYPSTFDG